MRQLKISLAILIALAIYQLLHWTTGITWPWTDYLYPYMVVFAIGPIFFRYIHIVKQWDKEEKRTRKIERKKKQRKMDKKVMHIRIKPSDLCNFPR